MSVACGGMAGVCGLADNDRAYIEDDKNGVLMRAGA